MNEQRSDFELLQGFVVRGDQTAFGEVVRRHLDLVYATSFRKVRDEGVAQEVVQNVFAALARKAWRFAPDDSLPAWLFKTTLLESKNWLRGEMRRRQREQSAAELRTTMKNPEDQPALRALLPLLDEALLSLRERDRTALLLRFYENRPLRSVGRSLGVGEDAAQKRVVAALRKVAEFFQKRGFRTATVASVTAALQHTASSAPISVAHAVVSAAAQMAPSAGLGLASPVLRLASLSKMQTAALCAGLLITPLCWERHSQRRAHDQLVTLQIQLAATQEENSRTQSEIDRFQKESIRLSNTLAEETNLSAKRSAAQDKFIAWKQHLRALLLVQDYHWPGDSPFVRIPKSVARRLLETAQPIRPPGMLTQAARELFGLTPQEREQVETALQAHFTAVDKLIEDKIYETNALSPWEARVIVPSRATVSKVWTIPALGDEVDSHIKSLETSLWQTLGAERWPIVLGQMGIPGTPYAETLRRILNLDAAGNPQQIAVWISNEGDRPTVGYGWQGNGIAFGVNGGPLERFIPGTQLANVDPVEFVGPTLPAALTTRIMEWLQQQAASLPQYQSAK